MYIWISVSKFLYFSGESCSNMNICKNTVFFVLSFIFLYVVSASQTLSPKNRGDKKKQDDKYKTKIGPQKYTVFDKKFVTETVASRDILSNYRAFFTETDEYNFNGLVLGYVTPVSLLFFNDYIIYCHYILLSGTIMVMI